MTVAGATSPADMVRAKPCPSCDNEIPGDSRFCPQCGAPQALACTACGHANVAGSRFCAQCGAKLGQAAADKPAAPAPTPAPPAARSANAAERRQITVMFCDLVGSTALSTHLDPEDLRDVIAAYHKCAAEVVTRFGGYVAKYMGDGVLAYFGYPQAHEDDAANAIRAALALFAAIEWLFAADGRHQVRIGLATGLVVVGELVGAGEAQERNVVGETPNLAARLQSIAAPNALVIDANTRRLAADLFEYEAIEPIELKGFQGPVAAWRVVRERTIAGRFEAMRAASQTPLVGRGEEMELLLRRWQQLKDGEGRVMLLAGEPGIGKSRLTTALEDCLKHEAHFCLRYFCQPHHQGSALHPIVGQLAHAAGFAHDDTPASKRAKFAALLAQTSGDAAEIELFAELLGLAASPAERDPQAKRRRILDALIAQLEALARRRPLLMLFEDAHWADPTTLELLTLTIDRLQSLPILLVITFRPDFSPPWTGQPHVTMLTLSRLTQRERATLVDHITGGKALPPGLFEQIVERTDGVPLFVEELTRSVLESEQLHESSGQYVLDRPAQPLAIPTTLQASLMSRVDRLGSAREVLQIGAAIGREFSYEVLAAVAGLADAVLLDALIRLTEAELVFLRGTPPNAIYTFKHALVQDAAYSNMLRTRRQELHAAIALVLEKRFPEVVKSTPEVIAQHFELAALNHRAIAYWQRAGERDLRRFAMKESIAHYANALRLVTTLPDAPERSNLELGVRLGLALAQQIGIGPTAAEPAENYQRALALSSMLPDRGRERFLATWGVWFHMTMSGRGIEGFRLADDLLTIARELDDSSLILEAHHARTPGLLWQGHWAATKDSALEAIRLYDRERHGDHAYYFGGHDSRVCSQAFHAISLWGLGYPDQAERTVWQCIEDARALGHIFSLAHGLNMGSLTLLLLADVNACQTVTDEIYPIAERNKFPWPLAMARFLRGWLAAQQANPDGGIEQMLKAADEPSQSVLRPMLLTLIAQQQMRAARLGEAVGTLERAADHVRAHQNRFYEPELIRLRGEIALAQSRDNATEAVAAFRRALGVAARQSCRSIELRAGVSLARLLGENGRRTEARSVLAPLYGAFTEGFARPDLQTAKALLAELD